MPRVCLSKLKFLRREAAFICENADKMNAKMKCLIALTGIAMTVITTVNGQAQNSNYWVIEGNVRTHDYTIVRFYDQAGNQLHEERLEGKLLDITKKKNVKMLNRKLRDFNAASDAKQVARKTRRKSI